MLRLPRPITLARPPRIPAEPDDEEFLAPRRLETPIRRSTRSVPNSLVGGGQLTESEERIPQSHIG